MSFVYFSAKLIILRVCLNMFLLTAFDSVKMWRFLSCTVLGNFYRHSLQHTPRKLTVFVDFVLTVESVIETTLITCINACTHVLGLMHGCQKV